MIKIHCLFFSFDHKVEYKGLLHTHLCCWPFVNLTSNLQVNLFYTFMPKWLILQRALLVWSTPVKCYWNGTVLLIKSHFSVVIKVNSSRIVLVIALLALHVMQLFVSTRDHHWNKTYKLAIDGDTSSKIVLTFDVSLLEGMFWINQGYSLDLSNQLEMF